MTITEQLENEQLLKYTSNDQLKKICNFPKDISQKSHFGSK